MGNTRFVDDELNYMPIVKAILRDPMRRKSVELEFTIDTGFQGGVLVPLKTYVELDLGLYEEPKVVAQTATGQAVELRVSRALISIDGVELPCTVYTALGVRRSLLGREILKRLGLLYKPPKELRLGL